MRIVPHEFRLARAPAVAVLGLMLLGSPCDVQAQAALAALRPALEKRVAAFHGTAGVVVMDPKTGESVAIRPDEPFPTASIIKVPILVELFQRVQDGDISLDDPIIMLDIDRQPGSGVLQFLQAPHELTVRDAAYLMIVVSDNTATNLLIDKLGIRNVNARMDSLGLPRTTLHSKTFLRSTSIDMDSSKVYGLGVTTPMEMAKLFALIYRGEAVTPEASDQMLEMLKNQQTQIGIPRLLPDTIQVAHKTGEIDQSRHDCGIIYDDVRDFIVCVLTKDNEDTSWRPGNAAYALQADIGRIAYQALVEGEHR